MLTNTTSLSYDVMSLASRHNLTHACVDDLMKLIGNINSTQYTFNLPKNQKQLDDEFNIKKFTVTYNYVCDSCKRLCFSSLFTNPWKNLKCCEKVPRKDQDHFVMFSLKEILAVVLPTVSFMENCVISQAKKDIIMKVAFDEHDLTLNINTDGVPCFSSSNVSLWPILCVINELTNIDKKDNVVMLGVWIGKKPNFQTFLIPLTNQLKVLSEDPIIWKNANGDTIKSNVYAQALICDSIARPPIQMMQQHNGTFGCPFCYINSPGHYFPHQKILDLRTHSTHLLHCNNQTTQAQAKNNFGVYGKCPLLEIPYFNMINGT